MTTPRDRYAEATTDIADHLGEKFFHVIRSPKIKEQIQTVLDPIVSSIIQRVFPYILLSAILFLILFILSIATCWRVMNSVQIGGTIVTSVIESVGK
jgi:hypothetical protein